jgi:hypothetical protein
MFPFLIFNSNLFIFEIFELKPKTNKTPGLGFKALNTYDSLGSFL